jgi:hypothetical protein
MAETYVRRRKPGEFPGVFTLGLSNASAGDVGVWPAVPARALARGVGMETPRSLSA